MADSFKTSGMTVKEILNMNPDDISRLNTREMSRALRTVSLAANKRITRLKNQAKFSSKAGGYVTKKSAKHNIALDALNAVTKDGKIKGNVFGVGKATDRNDMLKQFSEIRRFMNAKTSTIAGAKEVRQNREKRLLGKTSEQLIRKGKTKAEREAIKAEIKQTLSETYKGFRKYLEAKGRSNTHYENFEGSMNIINIIKTKVESTGDHEQGLQAALDFDKGVYEEEKFIQEWDDPFSLLGEE